MPCIYLAPHSIGLPSISLLVREVNPNASRNEVSYVINDIQALVSLSQYSITLERRHKLLNSQLSRAVSDDFL